MKPGKLVPAPLLFISSGIFQYVGAAVAVGLFAFMAPAGVAWWRILIGALVLMVLWRPWRYVWTRRAFLVAILFGLALGGMNILFYEAIAHLPLGVAVSIEFIGPVSVAVLRGKGPIPRIAAVLALAGIFAIGGWGIDLHDPDVRIGFLFVIGAAVLWATYIVIGSGISRVRQTGPSLAIGMAGASIAFLPLLYRSAFHVDFTGELALMLIGVAVFSTVIPYSIDVVAFGRVSADVFALLTALLPATSVLVGAVLLRQIPNAFELIGLVLVSVAVWLAGKAPQAKRPPKALEPENADLTQSEEEQ